MSRYEWPARGKKNRDRARARAAYNAATDGAIESQALIDARAAQPTVAPAGVENVWVPIGPSVVLNGQAGSKPRVAGRVRDIAVSADGLRVYAATANGGIWYSGDGGSTWSALGNWLPTPEPTDAARRVTPLTCGCLLVTFGNPASAPGAGGDEVLVGTGETVALSGGIPGGEMGGVGVLRLSRSLNDILADPFGTNAWRREAKNLVGAGIFRLDRDPSDATRVLAATSRGLFSRTGPFVEHAEWNPVDFGGGGLRVTDVAAAGARLWVAAVGASGSGVWTSTNGASGPFQKVQLPGDALNDGPEDFARLGLAVAPSDATTVYVLGSGPRLWQLSGVTSRRVIAVPTQLFDQTGKPYGQSAYDLAMAVHPDVSTTVVVGGKTVRADGEWSAALFRFAITVAGGALTTGFAAANDADPRSDPTFIGNSVHADVHQIRYVKVGAAVHLWVACDGGIFRSILAGDRFTFSPRNSGLAVMQPGYVACHPSNAAFVLAGTQDNGLQLRLGDTVWVRSDPVGGDAGGVVVHPTKSGFFASQYTNTSWLSNGRLSPPIARGLDVDSEAFESKRSSFYSGPSIRQDGSNVRLAVGSNRVWLAPNWDPEAAGATQWVTLPSGRDPRATVGGVPGKDTTLDVYGDGTGEVVACKWASANRLWALIRSFKRDGKDSAVLAMHTADSGATWTRTVVSEHHEKCGDFENGDIDQPTSPYLPPLGSWSDLTVHRATSGPLGSVYVAATGVPGADRMDTLWWFDGTNKWHPTGLRAANSAPAYAIVCDPDNPDIVYVGTALGVWRSELTLVGGGPQWSAWLRFDNGLPEAAVHDLAFHGKGAQKILRAAVASRGVFEVDLSTAPSPLARTYLRAHPTDARRQPPTDLDLSLAKPLNSGPAIWPWHASPDVRIRPAPLGPAETIPEPAGIDDAAGAWSTAVDPYMLWIFQTALHRTDPLCRADGQFTAQFRARLRTLPGAGGRLTRTRWQTVVTRANAFADPWEGVEPTEADLMELVVEDPPGPADTFSPPAVARVHRRAHRVDVLVHHRDPRPVPGTDVRVTLLRRNLPNDPVAWPGIAISPAWKDAVVQVLTAATPPASLPDSWTYADSGVNRVRRLRGPIDATTPRAVTFETSFAGTTADQRIMLLAVVHSVVDPVVQGGLVGTALRELILRSHQLAARVVRTRTAAP